MTYQTNTAKTAQAWARRNRIDEDQILDRVIERYGGRRYTSNFARPIVLGVKFDDGSRLDLFSGRGRNPGVFGPDRDETGLVLID